MTDFKRIPEPSHRADREEAAERDRFCSRCGQAGNKMERVRGRMVCIECWYGDDERDDET